jgi:hypothetical protein
MKLLYKFRSAEPLSYLVDILLEHRLYCTNYEELNDPYEGQFFEEIRNVGRGYLINCALLGKNYSYSPDDNTMHLMKSFKDLSDSESDTPKICSLTSAICDVRMWPFYASSHTGVAFELDFDGRDFIPHEVIYSPNMLIKSRRQPKIISLQELLTRKTEHWRYEQEHRIITKEEYVSVAGRIRRVILGARATPMLENLVRRLAGNDIPVVRASLEMNGVKIP